MSSKQILERAFFDCPETDMKDWETYPEVCEDEFEGMYCRYMNRPYRVHMFPYIRRTGAGEPYVEIYAWDKMLYPAVYTRFLIREGYRMPEKDEEVFLQYTEQSPYVEDKRIELLNEQIPKMFPQWNYPGYRTGRADIGMQHMYYASHRSGSREILYKAGLSNIAFQLDRLPDYNAIGSTPEKIIGHEIPVKMLRMLDQTDAVWILSDADRAEKYAAVYRKYSGFIGNKAPSTGQWKYLEALASEEGVFAHKPFRRTLYRYLEEGCSTFRLEMYEEYFRYTELFPEYKNTKLPGPNDIREVIEALKTLQEYSQDTDGLNVLLKARKKATDLEYFSDRYSVIMPENAADICREAIMQRNCVTDYIEDHAKSRTTILFVRKTASLQKPFVTMEVDESDHHIEQVYARFNELPEAEVYRFLEEYTRKKQLEMNPIQLVVRRNIDMDEYEELPDDIQEYINEYVKREIGGSRLKDPEPGKYIQLTLADFYPDMFGEAGRVF